MNNADPRFPGAPNQRDFVSDAAAARPCPCAPCSTKNIVNELRGGLTAYASGSNFGYAVEHHVAQRSQHVRGLRGFAITTPGNTTDWFTSNAPSWRKAPTYSIEDTLTWNRGAHTITDGGNC